jgi:hypothetical protein
MLCVCSMRNTEARPDCSQPASHPGLHSPALHTHTPPLPPIIPGPPKTKTETAKTLAENVSEVECTRPSTGTTWLAGSDIYIYMCVCVCVCVGAYVVRSSSGTDSVFRKARNE